MAASERTDCAGDPGCGGDGHADPASDIFKPAYYWGASKDGSRVFFTTQQALTDDAPVGGDRSLYMYDTTKAASDPHNLTLINVDREPADASNDAQAVLGTSDDGRYVYFVTTGQLVAHQPGLDTDRGFYVWHDGRIAFIGRTVVDETGEMQVSGNNYISRPPQGRVTPDGRHMLFTAHDGSGFSPRADHGQCQTDFGVGCREVYVYSADTGQVACASCRVDGGVPTTSAQTGITTQKGAATTTWHFNRAISNDGRRVFFTSSEPLVPQDVNGKTDVYEYDVGTGRQHLLSSGTDPSNSYFLDAGASGNDVFFMTRQRLVGWDVDGNYDLYDARAGGGVAEPADEPIACGGSECHASPPAPQPEAVPTSTFFSTGNAVVARGPAAKAKAKVKAKSKSRKSRTAACRSGYVRKRAHGKARCVKRKGLSVRRAGR